MGIFVQTPGLLNRYRAGDKLAFEKIYHEYFDEVSTLIQRGFVYSREKMFVVRGITDPSIQSDLIQETFVRCFSETARRGYDGKNPFRPYLLRITKNLMIDRMRKLGRQVVISALDIPSGMEDIDTLLSENKPYTCSDPGQDTHFKVQQKVTRSFVENLDENRRLFFELRYVRGESQERVAHTLGITRAKVRTLERGLRSSLKKHLKRKKLWP